MKRAIFFFLLLGGIVAAQTARWSPEQANKWYASQPWLVGSNYNPASAINELEMWQADTFDRQGIEADFRRAESLGMNTMRVFLHNLPWQDDPRGFRARIDEFLTMAAAHKIRPMFVLFDSCWDPNPKSGKQRAPKPGVHNSGWVQAPGADMLIDSKQIPKLEAYVKGIVSAFANDPRILAWDVWNEPDNPNESSYGKLEPANKVALVTTLLPRVFAWARAAKPTQPLTSGVWQGDWSSRENMSTMARIQLDNSDVISFHNYDGAAELEKRIQWLKPLGRPMLCTEYMARGNGSTFASSLPVLKKYKVAAYNWGFQAGKTQTYLPWDSWKKPYVDREPAIWFHEIFKADGTPYKQDEVDLIRSLTGKH